MGLNWVTNQISSLNLCSLKLIYAYVVGGLAPFGRSFPALRGTDPQISHSDQVVCCYCQGEVPIDLLNPSITGFAEQTNCFEPAEDLFNPLAELLARHVAGVPGSTAID